MNNTKQQHKKKFTSFPRVLVIGLTLFAAFAVFKIENTESITNEKLFSFPNQIGEWSGRDIKMDQWVFDALETEYAILKNYSTPSGNTVNLSIVWYDDKEIAFHSAAACLGGVGAFVKEDKKYSVKIDDHLTYDISKIIAKQQLLNRVVLYYYISDGYITGNQKLLRLHLLKKRMGLKRGSAAFVRIMTDVKEDEKTTIQILEGFLRDTLPAVESFTATATVKGVLLSDGE